MDRRGQLKREIGAFIERGRGDFDALALRLICHQLEVNAPYAAFAQAQGVSKDQVSDWRTAPAVPTDLFRLRRFYGGPSEPNHIFRTSGTMSGRRGEHALHDLDLYHASARQGISSCFQPDGLERPALMLAPPPAVLPDSSLSSMLGLFADEFSAGAPTFAWNQGLDLECAVDWLRAQVSVPVQILATSFALVELLDTLIERDLTFRLPTGSLMMTTGGNKGKSREVEPAALERDLCDRLGIAPHCVIAEYGMTELGSQFWRPSYLRALQGLEPVLQADVFAGPPWCAASLIDPVTGVEVPDGEVGMIVLTDLSNLDSVARVQTSDLGQIVDPQGDGSRYLRLAGRASDAVLRGCSLTIEES